MFFFFLKLASCVGILKYIFEREYPFEGEDTRKINCDKNNNRYYIQYIENGTCSITHGKWKSKSIYDQFIDDDFEKFTITEDKQYVNIGKRYHMECETQENPSTENFKVGQCYCGNHGDFYFRQIETCIMYELENDPNIKLTERGYKISKYFNDECSEEDYGLALTYYFVDGFGCYNKTKEEDELDCKTTIEGCNSFTTHQKRNERDECYINSYEYVPLTNGSHACFERDDSVKTERIAILENCVDRQIYSYTRDDFDSEVCKSIIDDDESGAESFLVPLYFILVFVFGHLFI